jgi:dTDP-4-dehydrorhamnose reductase
MKTFDKILLLGSSGMLGGALYSFLTSENVNVLPLNRQEFDANQDIISKKNKLIDIIEKYEVAYVINCAALADIRECEVDEPKGWYLNTYLPAVLSEVCRARNCHFTHISTDQFYFGSNELNDEKNTFFKFENKYALMKASGDLIAEKNGALVLRTSLLGYRSSGRPNLFEFFYNSILNEDVVELYQDAITSSIDVYNASRIIFEFVKLGKVGSFNIGTTNAYSKAELYFEICKQANRSDKFHKISSGGNQKVRRNLMLGLNVKLAESTLSMRFPNMQDVVRTMLMEGHYEH